MKKNLQKFLSVLVLAVALIGLTVQNVSASWSSNTSNVNTVNLSDKVKASATFAPVGIQVVNVGAGSDTLTDIAITLTGASGFDPAVDLATLTSDSSTSGVGVYLDNTPVGTFGAEDQSFTMSPGPSFVGSGPWTMTLNPTNANISADTTKNYLIVLRTSAGANNGRQVRVGLNSVTYATAGTKTNLAISAPSASTFITIDTAAPTVSTRITQDIDADGLIDAIKVTMNESIKDSTLTAANFAVAGYTVASVSGTANSSVANDEIFYINLTEGAGACSTTDATGCDSDAVPNVTYTAGTLTDHAGTLLATTAAVAPTDGAKPIAKYAKYKDTDNDGRVNRVDITFSEAIVSDGYNGADYAASTVGTINLAADSAVATSGDDLQITILGDAGKTGGATNPIITYTNNFVDASRGLNDAANNAVITTVITATDAAAPVINTVTIEDTDANGLVDKLTYTWSENVDTDDGVAPVAADVPTTLLPDGQTATFGSATFSDPAGISAVFTVTGVTGQVTKNTAAGSTAISGDLSLKWKDAASVTNAAHITGATANETITDSAAPVISSSTGSDSDNDGKTNTYVITFSENLTDKGAAAANANFTARNGSSTNAITVSTVAIGVTAGGGATKATLNLDDTDTDNFTGTIQFSYNSAAGGAIIEDAATGTNDFANQTNTSLTDDVKPVLLTARANNVGGTADVLDIANDWVEFKFSEAMTLPTIVNLELALLFANGATDAAATDSQNLHTTGVPDNTVSLQTTTFTSDTIRVTRDQDNSFNLLTPNTDTAQITSTGVTDAATTPNAGNTTPVAVTITLADLTAATFSTRETQDINLNGKLDAIKVTMNEAILDSTLVAGNYAVAGYTVSSVSGTANGSAANDAVFYINLTELSSGDTGALPTVTYTQGSMTDASGNLTATTGAVASTDKATPIAMSATYKDINTDGQVDRVDITFSEAPTLSLYNAADWAASTAGTINLGAETAAVVSGNDIQVSITGDANKTGGAVDPIITYTNNANRVTDAASNNTATFTVTATDAAAPVYVSSQTLDNNNDGTVDFVKVVYSESVLDSSVAAADYAAGIATTVAGNLTESFTSLTPSSGNVTDTANDASIYVGIASSGETLTAKKTDYTIKIEQVGAVTDALANSLASFASQTSTDGANPLIKTLTIEDATSDDGLIDKITFTWSENVDTDDSVAPIATDLPTTLLPDGSTANFSGATISDPGGIAATVVVTVITGQVTANTAAGSTAISGDLSAKWKDAASVTNAAHITGATGNETITDSAKPVFKTSTTADTNGNGTVDQITLVYSELVAITDGNAADAFPGVTFANGCIAANANYASASTTSSVITVTGCTADSTSITANPTYASASGQIDDLATVANEMINAETVTGTDGAAPAVLTVNVNDADADGDLDTANFTYSENLTNTAAGANGFDVTSASNHGTCNTESADPAVSSSLALTFVCSSKSTAVGDLNIAFTSNVGLQDSAGNNSGTKTFTSASSPAITDIAAPVPLTATVSKSVITGNLQNGAVIDVVFSEPVTPTSVTNANWKFSRSGVETLSSSNWPDGSTVVYAQGSTSSAVKMTLSAITTSGAWGPYTAKVNLAANNTSTIVDAASNQADIAASDVSISGIAGPSLNSTPVVTPSNLTATIAWTTVTNTTSNQVKYGTTVSLGSTSTSGTPGEGTTTHSISLSSLTASTLYYYQVCFTDVSEYCTTIDHFTTTATTDVAAPTISSQTPTDNSTSVAITTSPTITFSEAMDAATINGGTVKLRKYSDNSDITATLLYNPSTFVVTIDPVASLDNNTQYYIYSTGVKDVAGNTTSTDYSATTKASHEFTTVAESVSLAVTQIAATKTTMTADATYANGGSWTFNFTVPTSETNLQLKFTDWVSGSNTIAVANNMRIYSAQSSNAANSGAAITLTAANTYSTALALNSDLDSTTPGRQVQVVVDLKVPTSTSGGSYSTNYSAQSAS